jgi:hypothetical protein
MEMIILTSKKESQSSKAFEVCVNLAKAIKKSPSGVTFVSITGYTNQNGEISNNLINVGASYEKAKAKDIETLRNADLTKLVANSNQLDLNIARTELINSLIKPNENRSNGQKDVYTNIATGLKVHDETGEIYVWGFRENKTVVQKGEYKTVNSSAKTIAKKELKKLLELRTDKFTQYKISEMSKMKLNGEILEF